MNTQSKAIRTASTGLSKKTKVDYTAVGMNEMRKEVMNDTLKYLGKNRFDTIKVGFQKEYVEAKQFLSFQQFRLHLSMLGIYGFSVSVMLALELGMENNITEFNLVIDEWLDNRNGYEQEVEEGYISII